ncbi:MAG: ABC transporter permease [Alphaproteobacteria bacterium]
MRLIPPRSGFPLTVAALAFAFLGLFLVYPLFKVLASSFLDSEGVRLSLEAYVKVLSTGYYRQSILNSVVIGLFTTGLCIAIGLPMAFLLARIEIPGRSVLLALSALPLILPSFIGAYAWVLLLGRAGIVTQWLQGLGLPTTTIYGMPGLVMVFTLHSFPFVLLPALAAVRAVDASLEEAGQNLGASRWRVFRTVTVPVIMPAVLAGGLLVFIEVLENFGVPFVLAEDMPILAIEAYKLFVGEVGANPGMAGALAMLLVLLAAAALLLQRHYLARRRFATVSRSAPAAIRVGPLGRWAASLFVWGVVLLALLPFFAIVVVALMKFRGPVIQPEFSLDNFAHLFARSQRPLWNTLVLSTAAAVGASLIGIPIAYVLARYRSPISHALDVLAMVPFAVAGTVLAIGLVLAFNAGFLVLTGGWLILVLAWLVRKLPFSVRSGSAILHQIDPALEEASVNLGRPPSWTFFRLTVPLMLGGIVGGTVLAWVTIVSELSSTVVLYSGPWSTMTVVMFRALEGQGAGTAAAVATVLIAATVVPLALVYRLLRRNNLAVL